MSNPTTNHPERNIAEDIITKDRRNLFKRKEKENGIKDKIIEDIRILFELDEESYYEPVRIGNAFSSNYIEYENNGDKDKHYQLKTYLHKIRPYLSNMVNDLKTKGEWEIQLTIAINFCLLNILAKYVI